MTKLKTCLKWLKNHFLGEVDPEPCNVSRAIKLYDFIANSDGVTLIDTRFKNGCPNEPPIVAMRSENDFANLLVGKDLNEVIDNIGEG